MRTPVLVLAALAATAFAAPPEVLEIHNDTGQAMVELYVEPAGGGDWADRLEPGAPLQPGMWAELELDPAKGCVYEIEARTARGQGRRAYEVDLCATGRFNLSSSRVMAAGPAPGGDPAPPPPPPPPGYAPPEPLSRGLPICPGDPRCRRKK